MQKPLKKAPFAKAKGAFGCSLNDLNFIKEQFMYFKKECIDFFCFHAYATVPEYRYKELASRLRDLLDENGLVYTPKKSYETISHLATIFSGDVSRSNSYMFAEVLGESVMELLCCQTMAYERNGKGMYAYYLPLELGKMPEKEYKATVVIEGILEKPTLIDPYTGEVFSVEPTRVDGSMSVFVALLIKDYPLILTDESTFIIE